MTSAVLSSSSRTKWQDFSWRVLEALDLRAEALALGLRLSGEPNARGWVTCRAIDREDKNPSAGLNVCGERGARGSYKDQASGLKLGFFELAARRKPFSDWRAARDFYAQQLGISPPAYKHSSPSLAEQVKLGPDNQLVREMWADRKPGVCAKAVLEAGGQICDWNGTNCLVFWAFAPGRRQPVAGILYRINGNPFPATKKLPERKTHLLRGSRDGLVIVGGDERLATATVVWKCEGLTDALALARRLPECHVAITNACGACSFRAEWAKSLRGKEVNVVHDADEPGQRGAAIWAQGLASEGLSVSPRLLLFCKSRQRPRRNRGQLGGFLPRLLVHEHAHAFRTLCLVVDRLDRNDVRLQPFADRVVEEQLRRVHVAVTGEDDQAGGQALDRFFADGGDKGSS